MCIFVSKSIFAIDDENFAVYFPNETKKEMLLSSNHITVTYNIVEFSFFNHKLKTKLVVKSFFY